MPEIDILVAAPHPDDAELCCGGLLLKAKRAGLTSAVVDLTQGEMGTRGTIKTRMAEAAEASKLLGLAAREQAKLRVGQRKALPPAARSALQQPLRNPGRSRDRYF